MTSMIRRAGVVVPIRPGGLDGPTLQQVRGRAWRRTGPGAYVPTWVDRDGVFQRIAEAGFDLPERAGVTGWASLAWQRASYFDKGEDVPIAVGDRRLLARRPGTVVSEDWLFEGDLITVDGLRCTRPVRSLTYEARRARSLEDAIRIIDMGYLSNLVSPPELRRYVPALSGRPGVRRLREAASLASENSWSPMESIMRVVWTSVLRRPLLCNAPIFDARGRRLLTPDILDPEAGVAGEYDGKVVHLTDQGRRRDLNREHIYRELGIEVVTMMSGDLHDRESFVRRLKAAYARAAGSHRIRRWTTKQPAWWRDSSTVEHRRQLAADGLWHLLPKVA